MFLSPRSLETTESMEFWSIKRQLHPLFAFIQHHEDVLSEREAGALAQIAEHDHVIELEPGKVPRYKPLYNLSEK